jgi:putative membrane protein
MNTRLSIAATVALVAIAATALAQTPAAKPTTLEGIDADFAQKVADSGRHEVAAGNLVKVKATNAEVRAFAERMVTDHTRSGTELEKLVGPGKTPAKAPDLSWLEAASGDRLDRTYMARMVTDHETNVGLFEGYVKNGKDPALKAWANQKLPTLREHLRLATSLRDKLGSD